MVAHHGYVNDIVIIDLSDSLCSIDHSSVLMLLATHFGKSNAVYEFISSYLEYYSRCEYVFDVEE